MKNNKFLLHMILAAVLFVALTIGLLVRVWLPAAIIPPLVKQLYAGIPKRS